MSEYQEVEIVEPADAALPKGRLTRSEASAVVRSTVGARFKQARELNGWNQREAAVRMGYENGTQLSLIEAEGDRKGDGFARLGGDERIVHALVMREIGAVVVNRLLEIANH